MKTPKQKNKTKTKTKNKASHEMSLLAPDDTEFLCFILSSMRRTQNLGYCGLVEKNIIGCVN